MPKVFKCLGCGQQQQQQRPTGKNCTLIQQQEASFSDSNVIGASSEADRNQDIISALQAVSSRLSTIEHRISKTEEQLSQKSTSVTGHSEVPLEATSAGRKPADSSSDEEGLMPPLNFLKTNKQIQHQVDQRLQELSTLSEKGNFKSQRGGSDITYVSKQIAWPQNKVLAGSSKNRVSYDSLSIYQWVSGFSTTA